MAFSFFLVQESASSHYTDSHQIFSYGLITSLVVAFLEGGGNVAHIPIRQIHLPYVNACFHTPVMQATTKRLVSCMHAPGPFLSDTPPSRNIMALRNVDPPPFLKCACPSSPHQLQQTSKPLVEFSCLGHNSGLYPFCQHSWKKKCNTFVVNLRLLLVCLHHLVITVLAHACLK